MKTKMKTKNKNKTKIKFAVFLFFALAQMGRADISSGASIIAQDMIELTNMSRIEAGIAPLLINEKLAGAAREKANDMFRFQYFDHTSPNGTTPWDFIKSAGYEYKYAGENLAIDFVSANGAHKALMESSPHRDNILNMNYTEIGIAVKEDIFEGNKSIIIVEEFAAPLYKKTDASYSSSENVKLILEEKESEINNSSKEENIIENLEIKINAASAENKNEAGISIEEKNINTANNVLEFADDASNNELEDISALYNLEGNMFEEFILSLFPSEEDFSGKIAAENKEQKEDKSVARNKPILLAGNLNNERVMGLVEEASLKKAYLNKFKYQTSSFLNGYFQDELAARVLLLNLFLAILLIFDFWFITHLNIRRLMPKNN